MLWRRRKGRKMALSHQPKGKRGSHHVKLLVFGELEIGDSKKTEREERLYQREKDKKNS